MKKLIFILALVITVITANSQTATFPFKGGTLVNKSTNYTITNTTAIWFKFTGAQDFPATQDFQCVLDSASGNHTSIAISLYGRKFSGDEWTQIGSTATSTAGTDIVTISNTVQNRYREYKVNYQGVGTGTTTIDSQTLKVWLE